MIKTKIPTDIKQLTKLIVDQATQEFNEPRPTEKMIKGKNAAAVALGGLGGLNDGKAGAERLSPEYRKELAKRAARIRWTKVK